MSLSLSFSSSLPSLSPPSLLSLLSLSLSFRIVIYVVVIYSTLTSEVLTWQVLILPISLPHSTCHKLSMSTCLSPSHPQRTFSKDSRMNHRTRRRIPNRMSSRVPANGSLCVCVCVSFMPLPHKKCAYFWYVDFVCNNLNCFIFFLIPIEGGGERERGRERGYFSTHCLML